MRKQAPLVIMLVLVAAIVGASIGNTQATPPKRHAWEYTMVEWREMGAPGLVRLGTQGWELVAVTYEGMSTRSDTWYYFKRAK